MSPSQTVGTPAENVTPSLSNKSKSDLPSGEHELRADERRRVGEAPRVHVEHGDDGQDAVARRGRHRVGQRRSVRMEHRRTVRVQDAFGMTRGARRVTEPTRGSFVELGPRVRVGAFGEERFVRDQVGDLRLRGQVGLITHRDPAPDAGTLARDRLDERQERHVEREELVFGMIDDPDELLGREARIDRVDDRASAANRVVQLEVPVAIPR